MDIMDHLVRNQFSVEFARQLTRNQPIFNVGQIYKREDIVRILQTAFMDEGATHLPDEKQVASTFKGWGRSKDFPFESQVRGHYKYIGY